MSQEIAEEQPKKAKISIIIHPPETPTGSERMEVLHPEDLSLTMSMLTDTINLLYAQAMKEDEKAE